MNVYQPYRWYDLASPEHAARTRLTVHAPHDSLSHGIRTLKGDADGLSSRAFSPAR
ncbi:hypothetical protein ACFWXK_14030 [Streptomyces sp. NPDC059070]|uniref:hypothetical protein n=1 Tax=Streptomyces sp. NPDC059070 TaxID=3346713 RepID=UPI003696FC75